ncbi:MAG: hypothetical protein IEMM0007_0261 [bacterium]|nr:MAG: hypothetical protein IEMM0007_0261 [bacterium]
MLKLFEAYKDIICSYHIEKYEVFGDNLRLRVHIMLIDNSILYVRETIINGERKSYSYHWQDKEKKLLFRWDNAPDWDVETFPHHKHVRDVNNKIEPSYERTLDKVLAIIRRHILKEEKEIM